MFHFDELGAALADAQDALDHRLLNEVEGLEAPTLERIAMWLWNRLHNQRAGPCRDRDRPRQLRRGLHLSGPRATACRRSNQPWPQERGIELLGDSTTLPQSPDEATLERVPNPHADTHYVRALHLPGVHLALPGHRPARLRASRHRLRAGRWLVESKSLKLYLGCFRNHRRLPRGLHADDRQAHRGAARAAWLRIGGYWYPRGGIPIDVFWQTGDAARRRVAARPGRRALSRARLIAVGLMITNGDAAGELLRRAIPRAEVLPWRDVLHEGPVPPTGTLAELTAIRAEYLADRGWGEREEIATYLQARDRRARPFDGVHRVVLWFEHDLYDQLQLLQILDWFSREQMNADGSLLLVQASEFLGASDRGRDRGAPEPWRSRSHQSSSRSPQTLGCLPHADA